MRLGILSHTPSCYGTRRLVFAAQNQRHHVQVIDPTRCCVELGSDFAVVSCRSQPLTNLDAVIPRVDASVVDDASRVISYLEQTNVLVINGGDGVSVSHDVMQCLSLLNQHKICIPDSTFVRAKRDMIDAVARIGGFPVVLKVIENGHSMSVVLADTVDVAGAIFDTVQTEKQMVLVQRYVAESGRRDIRAFVVGDQVVAATRRDVSVKGLRRMDRESALIQCVELDKAYREMAVRAAVAMGLTIAGVDMLESETGPCVIGVTSTPELSRIELATNVDIAELIIKCVSTRLGFSTLITSPFSRN